MSAPIFDFPIDEVFGPEVAELIADVMRERARAIAQYGHSAAADDALGLHALGSKATSFMQIATDRATGSRERRNLKGAKLKAIQAAAIALSLIAAINREIEREVA